MLSKIKKSHMKRKPTSAAKTSKKTFNASNRRLLQTSDKNFKSISSEKKLIFAPKENVVSSSIKDSLSCTSSPAIKQSSVDKPRKMKQGPQTSKGAIYVGNLPHGFYEKALNEFFSQFGTISRIRVARSQKTARPMGYAYIEYTTDVVASIAAKAMDKYFIKGKILKCSFIDSNNLNEKMFQDSNLTPETCLATRRRLKNWEEMISSRDEKRATRRRKLLIKKKLKMMESDLGKKINVSHLAQKYLLAVKKTPESKVDDSQKQEGNMLLEKFKPTTRSSNSIIHRTNFNEERTIVEHPNSKVGMKTSASVIKLSKASQNCNESPIPQAKRKRANSSERRLKRGKPDASLVVENKPGKKKSLKNKLKPSVETTPAKVHAKKGIDNRIDKENVAAKQINKSKKIPLGKKLATTTKGEQHIRKSNKALSQTNVTRKPLSVKKSQVKDKKLEKSNKIVQTIERKPNKRIKTENSNEKQLNDGEKNNTKPPKQKKSSSSPAKQKLKKTKLEKRLKT